MWRCELIASAIVREVHVGAPPRELHRYHLVHSTMQSPPFTGVVGETELPLPIDNERDARQRVPPEEKPAYVDSVGIAA